VFFIRNINYFPYPAGTVCFFRRFSEVAKVTTAACLPTWPKSAHIGRNFVKQFIWCFLLQVVGISCWK
jgi:hypothetical protein